MQKGFLHAKEHPEFLENLRLLLTFPSIGIRTAFFILAEIVDIGYFSNGDKLSRWAGLVPGTHQSGYRKRVNGRIYKGGNKYLRRAVWMVALRSKGMPGNVINQFIHHLIVNKHKHKMTAITAGAHKVLRIIHAMLTKKQPFTIQAMVDVIKRNERNTRRKLSALARSIQRIRKIELMPRFAKQLEARHESLMKLARDDNVLATSLLGDDVMARIVEEIGGG